MYMILSGYGMYIVSCKLNKYKLRYSLKRCLRILINYWVVFIIFVPIGLVVFNNYPRYRWDALTFFKNLLTLSDSYNGEWWFLQIYIQLILLFPIIKSLIDKNIKVSFLTSILMYCSALVIQKLFGISPKFGRYSLAWNLQLLMLHQLNFCIGYLIAKLKIFEIINRYFNKNNLNKLKIYVLILIIILFIRVGLALIFSNIDCSNIDFILAPLLIFTSVKLLSLNKHNRIIILMGKHSTNIWLTHTFFCYYFFQVLVFAPRISILILIWLSILCILSSILINKIIKLLSNIFRRLEARSIYTFLYFRNVVVQYYNKA